jgi:hypothetical protein
MAIPVALRRDFKASQLRALARKTKDGPQARRLLALAAIYDGATRTEESWLDTCGWLMTTPGPGPLVFLLLALCSRKPRRSDASEGLVVGEDWRRDAADHPGLGDAVQCAGGCRPA